MDILLVNDFAYVEGGASNICLGSAKALAGRGHKVTLFTAVGPISPDLLEVANLDVICLHQHEILKDPNRLRAISSGLWNQASSREFSRCLKRYDPRRTIVHVHTWTKALSSSVARAATRAGFQTVFTLHDYFTACPTGSFFLHPDQKICHLKAMSAACISSNCDSRSYGHKLWRVARQAVQRNWGHIPSGIQHFITLSDLSQEVLQPYLPKGARLHRVPNFVSAEQQEPVRVESNDGFCFVGRLSPEKGPQLLAVATRELGLKIKFVGDGPMREEIAALAPEAVITGWLAAPQARTAMRAARALVLPSVWYETQGLVVAEAAAMGVPAIVPSTSAAREWIRDGVNGLLFRGGDQQDLQKKLALLQAAPQLAATLGRQAYDDFWRTPPTVTRHCEALERVYRSVLGDPCQQPLADPPPEEGVSVAHSAGTVSAA